MCGQFGTIRGSCATFASRRRLEITVVLLGKKLTLVEVRNVKQIECHTKKTESAIRISRSGSKAVRLRKTLLKLRGCQLRPHCRSMTPDLRFPVRSTALSHPCSP